MPGGPLEVGYGVSYLSIAIPVCGAAYQFPGAPQAASNCLLTPEAQLFVAFIWLLGPVAITAVYQCSPWSTDSPEAVRWSQAAWCFEST